MLTGKESLKKTKKNTALKETRLFSSPDVSVMRQNEEFGETKGVLLIPLIFAVSYLLTSPASI